MMTEQEKLKDSTWKNWGPYVSDRQWGTVREDYSADGDAWNYTTHDMARSKAWRWGEEGIGGICDEEQLLCFALSLWNKKDPILKERFFGLTNTEGNHGEDVKELYYCLDNTPTHSYMKMLYKYPQQQFPYNTLIEENKKRSRLQPEFEIADTGIFNDDAYFDVFIAYAKQSQYDILINITIYNRGKQATALNILPTLWFRNTWAWGYDGYTPNLFSDSKNVVEIFHEKLGQYYLLSEGNHDVFFCDNETNSQKLYGHDDEKNKYFKDGINEHLLHGKETINPHNTGTKAALNFDVTIPPEEKKSIRLVLSKTPSFDFKTFDSIFAEQKASADLFYNGVLHKEKGTDLFNIKRQALAGLLWNKQFYYFNVHQWFKGDPCFAAPPAERKNIRNAEWETLNTKEILSVPDKWEFPWPAAWDMAFHCLPLTMVDPDFAKNQLLLLTKEWYMHPNGQLPAYEWSFSDSNPPLQAMATWEIYAAGKTANNGKGDIQFLEKIFHKLMLNFTWWVNRKDAKGSNIFEGGFLGMDNIGVFDRSQPMPTGGYLEQADATSWMAMYSLNLLKIANELSWHNNVYADISSKFFEHFLYIAGAMNGPEGNLWDDGDNFYYDRINFSNDGSLPLKIRSLVGLIPLFVAEVLDSKSVQASTAFTKRMEWFKESRPDLANLVSNWGKQNKDGLLLISLMRGFRMKMVLKYLLDQNEFLSDYGIRSVSKYHLNNPYRLQVGGLCYDVQYTPGESTSSLFGGNSNWRGPVWMPMNSLIIKSLRTFHKYYGDEFKIECPTGSENYISLNEVADELTRRINRIFEKNEEGLRPFYGISAKEQYDVYFKDHILFHEYFDGDTGKGLGASHQTGWTALIASLL